ncbi:hypothetical protein H4219_004677 [Mycoemilia scoparia]|uniref:BHLH domain-containing protein n=1 Tax=Mycoemilia scoparia TaxID=417184 RepID=A0A9W8DL45_9FUNG|nr:hypothetical protein H4219_004677 [Mycoemilia scoparia]
MDNHHNFHQYQQHHHQGSQPTTATTTNTSIQQYQQSIQAYSLTTDPTTGNNTNNNGSTNTPNNGHTLNSQQQQHHQHIRGHSLGNIGSLASISTSNLTDEQIAHIAQVLTPLLSPSANQSNCGYSPAIHASPAETFTTPGFAPQNNNSVVGNTSKGKHGFSPLTSPALGPQSNSSYHQLNPSPSKNNGNGGGSNSAAVAAAAAAAAAAASINNVPFSVALQKRHSAHWPNSITASGGYGSGFTKPIGRPGYHHHHSVNFRTTPKLSSINEQAASSTFELTGGATSSSSSVSAAAAAASSTANQQVFDFLTSSASLHDSSSTKCNSAEEFSLDLLSGALLSHSGGPSTNSSPMFTAISNSNNASSTTLHQLAHQHHQQLMAGGVPSNVSRDMLRTASDQSTTKQLSNSGGGGGGVSNTQKGSHQQHHHMISANPVTPASLLNLPYSAHELPLDSITNSSGTSGAVIVPSNIVTNSGGASTSNGDGAFNGFNFLDSINRSTTTRHSISAVQSEPPGKHIIGNSPPLLNIDSQAGINRKRGRRKSSTSAHIDTSIIGSRVRADNNDGEPSSKPGGGKRSRRSSKANALSTKSPRPHMTIYPNILKSPGSGPQPSPLGPTAIAPSPSDFKTAPPSSSNALKPITPRGLQPKPATTFLGEPSMSSSANSDAGNNNTVVVNTAATGQPNDSGAAAATGGGGGGGGGGGTVSTTPSLTPQDPNHVISRLATKSNYQNILEGKTDELGLNYKFDLFSGLEQRRTSHKHAEQKRRDSLKQSFEQLKTKLPGLNPKLLSKIYLLNQAISYIDKLEKKNCELEKECEKLKQQNGGGGGGGDRGDKNKEDVVAPKSLESNKEEENDDDDDDDDDGLPEKLKMSSISGLDNSSSSSASGSLTSTSAASSSGLNIAVSSP